MKYVRYHEITHEQLLLANIVQFVKVKRELDLEWARTKGTERLKAIASVNLLKVEERGKNENRDKDYRDGSYRQQKVGGSGK